MKIILKNINEPKDHKQVLQDLNLQLDMDYSHEVNTEQKRMPRLARQLRTRQKEKVNNMEFDLIEGTGTLEDEHRIYYSGAMFRVFGQTFHFYYLASVLSGPVEGPYFDLCLQSFSVYDQNKSVNAG